MASGGGSGQGGGGFLRPGELQEGAFGLTFDRGPGNWRTQKLRQQEQVPPGAGPALGGPQYAPSVAPVGRPGQEGPPTQNPPATMHERGQSGRHAGPGPGSSATLAASQAGPGAVKPYRYGDPSLPVARVRRALLYMLERHATLIVVGETGSGKSTQIPQFLYEAGWAAGSGPGGQDSCIVCTQPRRVAASGVAARVAEEMGEVLGETVGYALRFENAITEGRTRIKFVTDGVLLREMLSDPLLSKYSVVMLDEAHERSLATDTLLGLLKKVQRVRPTLRLIISSATLQAQVLADFFDTSITTAPAAAASSGAPSRKPGVLSIEGRTHPVQVHYMERSVPNYVTAAVTAAVDIHKEDLPGDILIFLTGQEEVEAAVRALTEEANRMSRSAYSLRLLPLPLYADLPGPQQRAALAPAPRGVRKCVVSTNIAETSITLQGVVYVVDCMFVKQRAYNPLLGLDALLVAPVSKAQAVQRAGRAGRVRAGHCFRLCTQETYETMLSEVTVPEMQRSPLASLVLQLKALGIDNAMTFHWLSPPPAEAMVRALEELAAIKALDADARLTPDVGVPLSSLPLEPALGVALLAGCRMGAAEEVATAVALLAAGHLWAGGSGQARALEGCKARFAVSEGDLVTGLNVWRAWHANARSAKWAHKHMLSPSALARASSVRDQLTSTLIRLKLTPAPLSSCGDDMTLFRRAICAGMMLSAACYVATEYDPLKPDNDPGVHVYRLIRLGGASGGQGAGAGVKLVMHPSSVLFRAAPPWVVFANVAQSDSGRFEMQGVTPIEPGWLSELASHVFTTRGPQ